MESTSTSTSTSTSISTSRSRYCSYCLKLIDNKLNNGNEIKCYGEKLSNVYLHDKCINRWKFLLLDNNINNYVLIKNKLQRKHTLEEWFEEAHKMKINKVFLLFWDIYYSNLIKRGILKSRESLSKIDSSRDYENILYNISHIKKDYRSSQINILMWFKNKTIKEMIDIIKISKYYNYNLLELEKDTEIQSAEIQSAEI